MISERLKFYRLIQGMTQKDLRERSGVSLVSNLEAENGDLKLSNAIKLKRALGLDSVEDLLKPFSGEELNLKKDLSRKAHEAKKVAISENKKNRNARYYTKLKVRA